MKRNIASQGGCFNLLETELEAINNVYEYNYADLAGFMYAIQKSKVSVSDSIIRNNAGWSSAVLYSLANTETNAIVFKDCDISNNVASSMNFYLLQMPERVARIQ